VWILHGGPQIKLYRVTWCISVIQGRRNGTSRKPGCDFLHVLLPRHWPMVMQVLLISSLTFLLFCMPHTLNPGVFIVLAAKSGPCADNPCWSRGECHLVWINSTYATHKCNCSSGFVGVNCEHGSTLIDINIIIDFNILSIYFKHFKYVLLAVQCLTGLSHVQVIP